MKIIYFILAILVLSIIVNATSVGEVIDVSGTPYMITRSKMSTLKLLYGDKIIKTIDYQTIDYETGSMKSEDAYYYIPYVQELHKTYLEKGMMLESGDVVVGNKGKAVVKLIGYDTTVTIKNIKTLPKGKCLSDEIDNGNGCVSKCPFHMKFNGTNCEERCPSTSIDDYKYWDGKKCVSDTEDKLKYQELVKELDKISVWIKQEGVCVMNPLEDKDPTQVLDLSYKLWAKIKNVFWSNGLAKLLGIKSKGWTCQDFVEGTRHKVKDAVLKVYGSDSVILQEVLFLEKSSTYKSDSVLDVVDDLPPFQDNHILFKASLPDDGVSNDYYIDFWKKEVSGGHIIDSWVNGEKSWKDLLGKEFCYQQQNLLIGPESANAGQLNCS